MDIPGKECFEEYRGLSLFRAAPSAFDNNQEYFDMYRKST